MMKKLLAALLVLTLCLTGTAFAQTIHFEDGTVVLPALNESGEALEEPIETDTVVLLGITEDGLTAIYANGKVVYAAPEALLETASALDSTDLPELDSLETIQTGSDPEKVTALQQALIDMGYLKGDADGKFGAQSCGAVSSFQKGMGLKETGAADPVTQQLIFSLAAGEQAASVAVDPSAQFAAILDYTSVDLSPLYGQHMTFEYDDIAGVGFIGNGDTLHTEETGAPDIDRYVQDIVFGFSVTESKGAVSMRPVMQITRTSPRRPIIQSVLFKSGDQRTTIKVANTTSGVEGSKSVETDTVNLNATAIELLKQVGEAGELKLRLQGKYQSWDIEVPGDQLAGIAQIAAIADEMTAD